MTRAKALTDWVHMFRGFASGAHAAIAKAREKLMPEPAEGSVDSLP